MAINHRGAWLVLVGAATIVGCGGGRGNSGDAGVKMLPEASPPPPPSDSGIPPSAGGTGAFGIVTVNGKQKMYLPLDSTNALGHGQVVVVDVGVAGNGVVGAPARITTIDLGSPGMYATATGGDSSMIIAVSTQYPMMWFIDPTTDTLVKTIALDESVYGKSSFSGGGGYATGVAVDSANHRAIVSVWNGFAIVDLGQREISRVILAPPAENFGFDSVHQRILAPFYECSYSSVYRDGSSQSPPFCNDYKDTMDATMSDGLNIIDLADNDTIYTYQDTAAEYPNEPLGGEPDSAAADPNTGVVVVPSESRKYQNILDLSQATFDKAKHWVTAPHRYAANVGARRMDGVAVEATTHIAFFEGEGDSDIGVISLTSANAGPLDGGTTGIVYGDMPSLAPSAVSYWSNITDPHGIAVTTGISNGRAVGFLVEGSRGWVARIDLAAMLAFGTTDAALTDQQMQTVVTYLDATKP